MRRRYNLSKKQLETVKKELRKKDPTLSTESAQKPPGNQESAAGK